MKYLNIVYSNEEFAQIESAKKKSGCRNWHDYILQIAGVDD